MIFVTGRWALIGILGAMLALAVGRAQYLQPDPSFRPPVLESAIQRPAAQIAALPGGRVLVATNAAYVGGAAVNRLVRLTAAGTVDPTYTPPDFTGSSATPSIVYVYQDGRALVYDGVARLLRLAPNGVADASFAAEIGGVNSGTAADVDSQGRIWLRGISSVSGKFAEYAVLGPNGGAALTLALPAHTTFGFNRVAFQPDGRIVVAGTLSPTGGKSLRLFRLNGDGSLDASFDATAAFPATTSAQAVLPLDDGRFLVVTGTSGQQVVRILANGALDPTFSARFEPTVSLGRIALDATQGGKIYYEDFPGTGTILRRLQADGSPDPSFLLRNETNTLALPVTADGTSIFLATAATAARAGQRVAVSRYGPSGALLPEYAPRFSATATVSTVLQLGDGRYLVAGDFDIADGQAHGGTATQSFVRVNRDGAVDHAFSLPAPDRQSAAISRLLAVQPDGRILAWVGAELRRYNADGTPDAAFRISPAARAGLDASGRIYATDGAGLLRRYRADGSLDPAYPATGVALGLANFLVAPDGKVVLIEVFNTSQLRLRRLLADGTVDPAFNNSTDDSWTGAQAMMLPDGGVLTAGRLTTGANSFGVRIFRFSTAGLRVTNVDADLGMTHTVPVTRPLVAAAAGREAVAFAAGFFYQGGAGLMEGDEWVYAPTGFELSGVARPALERYRLIGPGDPGLPLLYALPANLAAAAGNRVSVAVRKFGLVESTFELLRNGLRVGEPETVSGGGDTLNLTPAMQAAEAGLYSVRVTNAVGSATTPAFRVDLLRPPALVSSPSSITVGAGSTLALHAGVTGGALTYRWSFNDTPLNIIGAGEATWVVRNLSAAGAGRYRCEISNSLGRVTTTEAVVTVGPAWDPQEYWNSTSLANVSVRARVAPGAPLLVGFVSGGTYDHLAVLIRATGPTLRQFGVADPLAAPQLTLRRGVEIVSRPIPWGGSVTQSRYANQVGAFRWPDPTSLDQYYFNSGLDLGAYTAEIATTGTPGTALLEVYDCSQMGHGPTRLINLSCRTGVSAESPLLGGFVISGPSAKTVLVRAIGPTLANFGVTDAVAATELTLLDAAGRTVALSLSSVSETALTSVAARVGAFPSAAGVNDSAVLVTLPPGAYTARVQGAYGVSGSALLEIYEVP